MDVSHGAPEVSPSEEFVKSLSPSVQARVEVLQSLQARYEKLEEAYQKELADLEEKYAALYGASGLRASLCSAQLSASPPSAGEGLLDSRCPSTGARPISLRPSRQL